MDELRVPTVPMNCEIRLVGGEHVHGAFHLPSAAMEHTGPPGLTEWLNAGEEFVPFQPAGRESHVILNKLRILAVTVPPGAGTRTDIDLPMRDVSVELEGTWYSGAVTIDMPPEHSRTLDVLNRSERFLCLASDGADHIVNRHQIHRVTEGRESGPI
jgi:hypothetical protein